MKRMQPAKSRALWLVLGAWCILLLGCQKPYETTKLPESISLNVTLSNTLQSDDKKRDHGLSYTQSLLSLISDETLKELLEIALANNTDILTLTSQIAQARENLGLASANMLPQLGLNLGYNYSSGNYNRYQININQNTLNGNLSLSWELDLFGKLNMLRKSKKFEYLAALSNLEAAKVSLIGEVATNFYTLQKVRNDILLNEQIVENNEKILKIAQAKYKLGLLDIATLSPLINTLASSKSSLNTLKLQEEQTKNALLVLLNTKDSTTITTLIGLQEAIILPDTTLPVIDDLPQEILLGREDIQASIANLNAQAMLKNSKKAALFPSISLGGSLGQILFSTRGVGDLIWNITGSLATPLLNRATLTKDYKIQKENLKQAFYTLENTVRVALGEIENAIKEVNTSKDSLQAQIVSLASSKELIETSQDQYDLGMLDEDVYLTNLNSYLNAKQSLNAAKYSQISSVIVLYKAFGGKLATLESEKVQDSGIDSMQPTQDSNTPHSMFDPLGQAPINNLGLKEAFNASLYQSQTTKEKHNSPRNAQISNTTRHNKEKS